MTSIANDPDHVRVELHRAVTDPELPDAVRNEALVWTDADNTLHDWLRRADKQLAWGTSREAGHRPPPRDGFGGSACNTGALQALRAFKQETRGDEAKAVREADAIRCIREARIDTAARAHAVRVIVDCLEWMATKK
jgi:hypothetical protein